ncbi:MAG TPA: hypothetical protein QGH10_19885 [Armatimonadota bacterium]|nr:hypothetical protein [Armatimonadota bacterium]
MTRPTRATAIAAIALCLTAFVLSAGAQAKRELTRESVLEEAWELAQLLPSLDQRAVIMADVAIAMRETNPIAAEDNLAEAAVMATNVRTELGRALALQAVARRLVLVDPKWGSDIFTEATVLADRLTQPGEGRKAYPAQASLVYIEIALGRAEEDVETAKGLLGRAAEQARAIADSEATFRIAALRDVSEAYAGIDDDAAQALFDEALAGAHALEDPVDRDLSLADLAGFIAKRSLQQAISVAGSIADPAAKSQALRDVALEIPPADAAMALELALSIPDAPAQVSTLTDIALGGAPEDVAAQAAQQAGDFAATLEKDDTGLEARAAAAVAWAATDVDKALEQTKRIDDEYFAANARSRIATYLAPRDTAKALEVLETIERGVARVEPLRAIVDALAEIDAPKAYKLATEIRSRRFRVEAFLTIAEALPEPNAEEG